MPRSPLGPGRAGRFRRATGATFTTGLLLTIAFASTGAAHALTDDRGKVLAVSSEDGNDPVSPGGATEVGGSADTLTVGTVEELDSLNPMTGIMSTSLMFQYYLWEGLTSASHDDITGQSPGLAESWEVSSDGQTVTYHLRPGLQWSDGSPLTAADPEYMLNRIRAGGPGQGMWGNFLDYVTAITAVDEVTLRIDLAEPNAILPKMPIPILPKHVLEQYPDDALNQYPLDPEDLVTSGPYRLVEGSAGSALFRFEAWPGSWRGESPVKHVNWRFFKAEDTVMQAVLKGEVDYTASINPLQVRVLKQQPSIVANQYANLGTFREIGFNTGSVDLETGKPMGDPNPAVLDPKFRYALSTAFDRDAVSHKAYKDGLLPLKTVIGLGFERYQWEVPTDEPSDYDPELAAKRLENAGYALDANGSRLLPNGSPVGQLRIAADSGDQTSLLSAQLVREWMQNLGLDVRVVAMRNEKLNEVVQSGNFDMYEWGWGIDDDPDSILMYFTCAQRGVMGDTWYCSEEYDSLYAKQKHEIDRERRAEIIKDMQRLLYQDAPYIVIGNTKAQQAYRTDRWDGWTPALQPNGDVLVDVASLYDLHPTPGGGFDRAERSDRVAVVVFSSIAGLILVVLLTRFAVVRWRRSTAEERE